MGGPHAGRCYIEAFLLEVPRRFAKQGMTILNTKSEIRIKIHGKTVHMKWSILAARAPDYFCVALSEKNGRDFLQTVLSKFVSLVPNGSEIVRLAGLCGACECHQRPRLGEAWWTLTHACGGVEKASECLRRLDLNTKLLSANL